MYSLKYAILFYILSFVAVKKLHLSVTNKQAFNSRDMNATGTAFNVDTMKI